MCEQCDGIFLTGDSLSRIASQQKGSEVFSAVEIAVETAANAPELAGAVLEGVLEFFLGLFSSL